MTPVGPQHWRFILTMALFAGLFAALCHRLQTLQISDGERLAQAGNRQHERTWILPAPRGPITDAAGAPLAESERTWVVSADPVWMDDRLRATVELSRILGIPRDKLRTEFECGRNGRVLARDIDDQQAAAVKALDLTGINVRQEYSRLYREGGLAAHLLGYVDEAGKGSAGIEGRFEAVLAGVPGHQSMMIDAHGKPLLDDAGANDSAPARPGGTVALTIDVVLQRILEKELAAGVDRHRPKNAAGIIIRPATGEILAMASWPSFDPDDRRGLDASSMRNNVLSFVYEPGSTMKPLVAGAAVACGVTTWNESIFCEHGHWTHREGRGVRTIRDHSGHGTLTVTQGIALSDNILMAKLGLRLGVERLHDWVASFGFGKRTGICLAGEDAGIMLARPKWTALGSCMSVPMGHEIAVTPLQLAMAHSMIANLGLWMPPRIVKSVTGCDADGNAIELPGPPLPQPKRMFAPDQAAAIQEAMTHTMTEGTGKGCQLDGFVAAGKTGTAEKLVDGHYSEQHHVGSFVCWAPANAGTPPERKLLCLVVIDDPSRNGNFGADTAAPVVQRVLQQALDLYDADLKRPDLPKEGKDGKADDDDDDDDDEDDSATMPAAVTQAAPGAGATGHALGAKAVPAGAKTGPAPAPAPAPAVVSLADVEWRHP
jgi:cell division protein FtsI (penicillin-binding protein 3)